MKKVFDAQADENGVLKNRLGIRDQSRLTEIAAEFAYIRVAELAIKPLPGKLDSTHLRDIHRYTFQDVYPWAGNFRTVRTSRSDSFGFPPPIYIEQSLNDLFAKLAKENHLKQLDRDRFADRAGYYLSEINAVHAFRDGNGRAQREFLRTLALHAGHRLVWTLMAERDGRTVIPSDVSSSLSSG